MHSRLARWAATLALLAAHGGRARAQAPPTTVVSLEALLEHADTHAPPLVAARARLALGEAARAGASVRSPYNPRLGLNLGPAFGSIGTHADTQITLTQRLEGGRARRARRTAASRTDERLRAELERARWSVHAQVHAAFHAALVARERRAGFARLLAFHERLVEITRQRLRAGDVSEIEIRLAEGELARAQVEALRAERDYVSAQLTLAELAGWPITSLPEPAGTLEPPRDPPDSATLWARAEQTHPRLRVLSALEAEAEAQADAAEGRGRLAPTVGVQLSLESAPADPNRVVAQGVLQLPIPAFQRNQGAVARARADADIAAAEARAELSSLRARIERLRVTAASAAAQLRAFADTILPTSEENLRLLERAFELGEIDVLQVSGARERVLRSYTDYLVAYDDYFRAVAELEAAVGGELFADERHEAEHGSDRHPEVAP